MDIKTVGDVIDAIVATYLAGLEHYTNWQRRKRQENHYKTHSKGSICGGNACALSVSLSVSSYKIKEVFENGTNIFGDGFANGDDICRESLHSDLRRLRECMHNLEEAIQIENKSLGIFEVVRISELVRVSCLAALAGQYKRIAVGRLVPHNLPAPQSQQQSRPNIIVSEEDTIKLTDYGDGELPYLRSKPLSPPPTPKQIPDDLQSTYTSTTSGFNNRPKKSIFSMFCPGALKYQVDPRKPIPRRRNCRCGYEWNGAHTENKTAAMVKEGFHMTARFLGKSHREGGFGCVLCASSGKTETETYVSVESLRDHINTCHTKWQMLHDRDMASQR
ncbi:hypothetical protein M426DRAFT_12982 [Hypoxylon sp. CI-4A]|nr:hypothetical protein M426DRAFT_12982 [Hypoxylon sp. CI-4A]